MKTLVGGAITATLGLILLIFFKGPFFNLIKGTIPALLLIGGGLALYLGFDELQDTWRNEGATSAQDEEKDQVIAKLKNEIDELKKD